ncbi:MAG: hypothetical protein KY412_07925 [Actinobacteria bacterium]|nr:hypothetical protein [Actinomycetota bacterium]
MCVGGHHEPSDRDPLALISAQVPDRYRRVVELVDIEGLSYRGAAESLGVPVGTVMSRLQLAGQGLSGSP